MPNPGCYAKMLCYCYVMPLYLKIILVITVEAFKFFRLSIFFLINGEEIINKILYFEEIPKHFGRRKKR